MEYRELSASGASLEETPPNLWNINTNDIDNNNINDGENVASTHHAQDLGDRVFLFDRYEWLKEYATSTLHEFLPDGWPSITIPTTARAFTSGLAHLSTAQEPAKPTRKLHPTAWLDGLRGIASFLVLIHHSSWLWYPGLLGGYGSSPDSYYLIQLPIIRTFYAAGSAMVAIFFIVSGFSLSYKALGLIRSGHQVEVLDALSSSVYRRGLRLVIPPAVTTFGAMIVNMLGWYGTGVGSRQPVLFDTFGENLAFWLQSVKDLGDPFRPAVYPGGYNPPYDTNLWTIPVELHGSMVIFLVLLGLTKVKETVRLAVLVCIVLFLLYNVYTHLFLFLGGVLLAELHYIRETRVKHSDAANLCQLQRMEMEQSQSNETYSEQYRKLAITIFWILNLLISLFICSMPIMGNGASISPGYKTLFSLIPSQYRAPFVDHQFWIHLAAFQLVWTLDNAKFLQVFFTTWLAQYLGKISFALYILHGTFLYTIGWNLSYFMWGITGAGTGPTRAFGLVLTALILYPCIFWTANIVAKHVDAKSVKFARWLWLKAVVQ